MDTDLHKMTSLQEVVLVADERLEALFKSAREREEELARQKRQLTEDRMRALEAHLRHFLPAAVMPYIDPTWQLGERDFLDASISGFSVKIEVPGAFPIFRHCYFDIWAETWHSANMFYIHDREGRFLGQHEDFLLALGAARKHSLDALGLEY